VTVVVLSRVIWKVINSVRKMTTETIERQRIANAEKDKIILELSKRLAELE